jgi:hypothetical protein
MPGIQNCLRGKMLFGEAYVSRRFGVNAGASAVNGYLRTLASATSRGPDARLTTVPID